MKCNVYSIRDVLTGFMTPIVDQNDATALRNFTMACSVVDASKSTMSFRPSDYSLYRIAVFDTESGSVEPLIPIQLVANGSSVGGTSDA